MATSHKPSVSKSLKDELDQILDSYMAKGGDGKDKLLGAAFVVVNRDGIMPASYSWKRF